jgi:hypothetical protein
MNIRDHINIIKERDYRQEQERRSREPELTSEEIAAHVAEYLERGGRIEVVPGFRQAPPAMRCRAYERAWS